MFVTLILRNYWIIYDEILYTDKLVSEDWSVYIAKKISGEFIDTKCYIIIIIDYRYRSDRSHGCELVRYK